MLPNFQAACQAWADGPRPGSRRATAPGRGLEAPLFHRRMVSLLGQAHGLPPKRACQAIGRDSIGQKAQVAETKAEVFLAKANSAEARALPTAPSSSAR